MSDLYPDSATYIEQCVERKWTLENGWTTTRKWEGTKEAIASIVEDAKINASEVTHTHDKKKAVLTATYSDQGQSTGGGSPNTAGEDVGYNLTFQLESKELSTFPIFNEQIIDIALFFAARRLFETDWEQAKNAGKSASDYFDTALEDVTGGTKEQDDVDALASYMTLWKKGVREYRVEYPVLRVDYKRATTNKYKEVINDINQAVSPSTITSLFKDARFEIPTFQYVTDLNGTLSAEQTYIWIKGVPQISKVGLRYAISIDYTGVWTAPKILYGPHGRNSL